MLQHPGDRVLAVAPVAVPDEIEVVRSLEHGFSPFVVSFDEKIAKEGYSSVAGALQAGKKLAGKQFNVLQG
jgi:hypothetical protein